MVAVIRWIDEVESTNRTARSADFGHGDVIVTTNQTAGRGRMDRVWSMEPGAGVAMTVVVSRTSLGSPARLTLLPLSVAVGVAEIIATQAPIGVRVSIKWPNDVLVGSRKVAGILIESLDADRLAIGIGVNLTGVPAGIPAATVTSLATEGIVIPVESIVTALAESVAHRAHNLDEDTLLGELHTAIETVGQQVRIELPDGRFVTGRVTGIGSTGSLIVDTVNGPAEFVAGDVTHLRLGGDELVR